MKLQVAEISLCVFLICGFVTISANYRFPRWSLSGRCPKLMDYFKLSSLRNLIRRRSLRCSQSIELYIFRNPSSNNNLLKVKETFSVRHTLNWFVISTDGLSLNNTNLSENHNFFLISTWCSIGSLLCHIRRPFNQRINDLCLSFFSTVVAYLTTLLLNFMKMSLDRKWLIINHFYFLMGDNIPGNIWAERILMVWLLIWYNSALSEILHEGTSSSAINKHLNWILPGPV